MDALDWLLDSDPAIRWQAIRDLSDASQSAIAAERVRVAREGIGARILACQESDGAWRRANAPTWLPTLSTMLLLRATGADPSDPGVVSAVARLEAGMRWSDQPFWELRPARFGGTSFFAGEEEPCINGGVLALGAYFGRPTATLAHRLVAEQLEDGGWNCDAPKSARSSFHTTICVLEGLLEYERVEADPQVTAARRRGEEYLLTRSLFRRLSTGEVVDPAFLQFAYPPRYQYDVLRALDYFREAGAPAHPRVGAAIRVIESKRQAGGRWLLDSIHEGVLAIPLGESVGASSRWNTLRALRVLRWYGRPEGDFAVRG